MNKTGIEYLDYSWNPIAMRCTRISEGCKNCWHLRMADRLVGNHNLPFDVRRAYAGEGPPVLVEERLVKPIRRKKPAIIGVQFMGDLFHKNVPTYFIIDVWRIMRDAPQHTFQILTKRPYPMLSIITDLGITLPNVWLGVSVENQARANERIPLLLQTPACLRYVSAEPLLGPTDLLPWLRPYPNCGNVAEDGTCASSLNPTPECHVASCPMTDVRQGISWVVVGGESGSGARPMHPDWARSIRDQCQASGTPYFFKQHGAWLSMDQVDHVLRPGQTWADVTPHLGPPKEFVFEDGTICVRLGKKFSGRLLDGQLWEEMLDVG